MYYKKTLKSKGHNIMKRKISILMVVVMILISCSFTITAQESGEERDFKTYCNSCGQNECWYWCTGYAYGSSTYSCSSDRTCVVSEVLFTAAFRCNNCGYNGSFPHTETRHHSVGHVSGDNPANVCAY